MIKKKIYFNNNKDIIIFFASIAGVLSFIENFFPRIFIFLKVGFGNIPVLLLIDKTSLNNIFFILLLKSLISLFFSGTLLSPTALISFSGNLGAFTGILILRTIFINKKLKISLVVKSIFIAYFSNLFQLIVYSFFIIKDTSTFSLVFVILIISFLTGAVTGAIAKNIENEYIEINFET
jgi:uncharacterized membrane protein